MLVLFYGPSGVGKTTTMQALERRGWFFISTYMTRPRRSHESEKFTISVEEFREMEKRGEFFCQTHLYGNDYGTPRAQVMYAAYETMDRWMLDFAFQNRHLFEGIPHLSIILIPQSWEQLAEQLVHSGRGDRILEVAEDYEHNYRELKEENISEDILVVINGRNKTERVADFIDAAVGARMRSEGSH